MAVYFPVPVTPNGRHDAQHNPHPQWPSPSAFSGLVSYGGQHLGHQPYPSPSSHSQAVPIRPQSAGSQQPLTHHWQQQLIKYEASRSAAAPHHRARTSAFAMRNSAKQAIPITNPNLLQHKQQGSISERTDTGSSIVTADGLEPARQGTPSTSDHPSATNPPVSISPTVAPRPTFARPKEDAAWTTLDMGGMRLKNLAPSLFKLTYLTTLYVNHNQLGKISPAISQLRHLILLDLSSNQLASLPSELGMCTSLRELLLFDNQLETLPTQLGTLHQLVMIGLEGNPMRHEYREILQKDGTQALIAYLRDSAPFPPAPPQRQWKFMPPPIRRETELEEETLTLVSYNILCERCATTALYGYTPSWALGWDYRKDVILTEITNLAADILCLQEVDITQYEGFFSPKLEAQGYDGIFFPKSRAKTMSEAQRKLVDGCATFFKKDKFALVEQQLIEFNSASLHLNHHRHTTSTGINGISPDQPKSAHSFTDDMYNRVFTKDNIAVIALLENRKSGSRLIVVNVHEYWDKEFSDVKLIQTSIMMEELEKAAKSFQQFPPRLLDGSHDGTKVVPPTPAPNGAGTENGNVNGAAGSASESSGPEAADSSPPTSAEAPANTLRLAPTYDNYLQIPTIVCGDFNSLPSSGVYEFLGNGNIVPNHEDFMTYKYGRYTDSVETGGGMRHSYSLKNAYATVLGTHDIPLTNYTPSFKGAIDHIWYTNQSLAVEAVLGPVPDSYLDKVVGFPDAHNPSDHISIVGEFRVLKPKKDANGVPNPGPRPTAFFNSGKGRK